MALLVIIPISKLAAANAAAQAHFDQPGPPFLPALSADGSEPATHAWLSCEFRPQFRAALDAMVQMPEWADTLVIEWSPGTQNADELIAGHGLVRTIPTTEP